MCNLIINKTFVAASLFFDPLLYHLLLYLQLYCAHHFPTHKLHESKGKAQWHNFNTNHISSSQTNLTLHTSLYWTDCKKSMFPFPKFLYLAQTYTHTYTHTSTHQSTGSTRHCYVYLIHCQIHVPKWTPFDSYIIYSLAGKIIQAFVLYPRLASTQVKEVSLQWLNWHLGKSVAFSSQFALGQSLPGTSDPLPVLVHSFLESFV